MSYCSGGVGILKLYALLIYLFILRWYICGDDQDLAIRSLEPFPQIVRGDGHTSD
jgi:hypothetical protein